MMLSGVAAGAATDAVVGVMVTFSVPPTAPDRA